MKRILTISLVAQLSVFFAQEPDTVFQKVFYSPQGPYMARTLAALEDDGAMILGDLSWGKAALTRVDSAGTQIWTKQYRSMELNTNLHLRDMISTFDNANVSVGHVLDPTNSKAYLAIMKTDQNGDTLWTARFNKSVAESLSATAVCQGVDSSILFCGYGTQNGKGYLLKLDSLGNLIWEKELSVSGSLEPYAIRQISDGTIYLIGNRTTGIPGQGGFMMRVDAEGNFQSAQSSAEIGLMDIIDHEGKLYLLASYGGILTLVKMDYSGNLIWKKGYYYTTILDYSRKPYIRALSDGNLMVMYGDRWFTTHLIIADQDGNLQIMQNHLFGGSDVVETKKKGLFMIGYGPLYGLRMLAFDHTGLVRMDSTYSVNNINCAWVTSVATSDPNIEFSSIMIDASPALVKSSLELYYETGGLSEQSGCVEMWGGLGEHDELKVSVSPNPTCNLVYLQQREGVPFTLLVTDLNGRKLIEDEQPSTEKQLNLATFGAGVYIYQVRNEKGSIVQGRIVVE